MSYHSSEKRWADFWLGRAGWGPGWGARKITGKGDKSRLVGDIGGAHGRDSLWLKARGFRVVLLEPNWYSLQIARNKTGELKLGLDIIRSALPDLPVAGGCFSAVNFHWGLHSYPDEEKLPALKEIHRVMAGGGLLFSVSFGSWSGYQLPPTIHAVSKRGDFIAWHERAGFRAVDVIELMDETYSFEKSWCGEFERV